MPREGKCPERANAQRGQMPRKGRCQERADSQRRQMPRKGKCTERAAVKKGQMTREGRCSDLWYSDNQMPELDMRHIFVDASRAAANRDMGAHLCQMA